jgi:DNA gyrase/topoisomerase IV subunit A
MVISQFGKIIRIDTKSVRAAGRSTSGVRRLNLEADDKAASAPIAPMATRPGAWLVLRTSRRASAERKGFKARRKRRLGLKPGATKPCPDDAW